mgnify:CR=1 FL=1
MSHWIIAPVILPAVLAAILTLAMRHHPSLQRVFSIAGVVAVLAIVFGGGRCVSTTTSSVRGGEAIQLDIIRSKPIVHNQADSFSAFRQILNLAHCTFALYYLRVSGTGETTFLNFVRRKNYRHNRVHFLSCRD